MGRGGIRLVEREGSRMRENRVFFFFFLKEEQERRMQRNGVIGQEFVCVKTKRWCTGKTHTHAHTEGLFIRVSTLEGNRPA